jgi:hypothetical protein
MLGLFAQFKQIASIIVIFLQYSSGAAKLFFLAFTTTDSNLFILGFQGFMIVERASLYGSRNMLDQHRDMRLDVDSMSYEVITVTVSCVTIFVNYFQICKIIL